MKEEVRRKTIDVNVARKRDSKLCSQLSNIVQADLQKETGKRGKDMVR